MRIGRVMRSPVVCDGIDALAEAMVRWAPMAACGGGALFVCARLLAHLELPSGFPVEAVTSRPALTLWSLVGQDLLMIPLALAVSSLPRLHAQYGRALARSTAVGTTLVWAGTLTLLVHAVGLLLGGSASFGANFAALYGFGMLAFLLGMVVLGWFFLGVDLHFARREVAG